LPALDLTTIHTSARRATDKPRCPIQPTRRAVRRGWHDASARQLRANQRRAPTERPVSQPAPMRRCSTKFACGDLDQGYWRPKEVPQTLLHAFHLCNRFPQGRGRPVSEIDAVTFNYQRAGLHNRLYVADTFTDD